MRNTFIFFAFVCFGCMAQNKENEKLVGDWIETKRVRYDRQKWMTHEPDTKHFIFFANGKFEDWTHESDVQGSEYHLSGNDLLIGNVKYKVDSISDNGFILFTYKEILDIKNDNPYSRKFYFKKNRK